MRPIPIYFINLERAPERLEYFLRQADSLPRSEVILTRFEAIDPQVTPLPVEARQVFDRSDFLELDEAPGVMGCALSHLALWRDIAAGTEVTTIFEDDALLAPNLVPRLREVLDDLPEDAEVVYIGRPVSRPIAMQEMATHPELARARALERGSSSPLIGRFFKRYNPGTIAYVITPDGAGRMLERAEAQGVTRAIDAWMNDVLEAENTFYGTYEALATHACVFPSTIRS